MAAHLHQQQQSEISKIEQQPQLQQGGGGGGGGGVLRNNAAAWSMGGGTWRARQAHQQWNASRVPQPTSGPASAAAAAVAEDDSWEVRAFAEDAASCSGQWPPRSYSCSFCAREFRTAQALGGHMNVHRRERAYANQLGLISKASTATQPAPAPTVNLNPGVAPPSTNTSESSAPALGFCWVYPYNPATVTRPPPIHVNSDGNFMYQQPLQHQLSQLGQLTQLGQPPPPPPPPPIPQISSPAAIFSSQILGHELSLSPPNPSNSSSLSHNSASLNSSSGSDSSTGSLRKKEQPDQPVIKLPDLSAMKLIVLESNQDPDLELRLGRS